MIIRSSTPAPVVNYDAVLQELVGKKWEMVSEGPSGAQLKGPKKMRMLDKGCLVLGAALLLFQPIVGAILVAVALVDFAFLTKQPTHFLSRESPARPA